MSDKMRSEPIATACLVSHSNVFMHRKFQFIEQLIQKMSCKCEVMKYIIYRGIIYRDTRVPSPLMYKINFCNIKSQGRHLCSFE